MTQIMPDNNSTEKQKSNKSLWVLLTVAFIAIAGIVYMYIQNNVQMREMVDQMTEEKIILTQEFQNLSLDYDSLESNNDSLNLMLEHDRERISQLIEELKTVKAANISRIREYKKELGSLRGVLKSYVYQIDSLNQTNKELRQKNVEYRQQYTKIQDSYKELEKEKQNLSQKVEIASKLETSNYETTGLTSRDKETKRTSRVVKIRVCFTILKNLTAQIGEKPIYMRIERPDGALLMHSLDDKFEYEGSEINFSATRTIEYGGDNLDVCIYYNADAGELLEGEYAIDLFCDGNHIGKCKLDLK